MNYLAHQNRTITIASDFCADGAKSPEIAQRGEVLGSEIAVRIATLLSLVPEIAAISGVRDEHHNRKSQQLVLTVLVFWPQMGGS